MGDSIDVTVVIITYNQEMWIRQTIESVLAQQTDCSYEVVIGDDYSSDKTRSICQEYADKYDNVKLLSSAGRNVGVTANWIRCVKAGTGKYIMSCAGDDYWHNTCKIQKQVDFMERHPNCVICHTDIDVLYENKGCVVHDFKKRINIPQGYIQKLVLQGKDSISAVTMCIRREAFEKYIPAEKFVELEFPREDWPTILILSAYGEILYIDESTATYRVGQESITNTFDYEVIRKRCQQDKIMTKYIYTLFPEWGTFSDDEWFDNIVWHRMMKAAYRNNDYKSAHRFAKRDKYPTLATHMAATWLSFKIYRWFAKCKNKY